MEKPRRHCGVCTNQHSVPIPIKGRVRSVDFCLSRMIAALVAGGVETVACCCGHGKMIGNIVLESGEWIGVFRNWQEWGVASEAVKKYRSAKRKNKSRKGR